MSLLNVNLFKLNPILTDFPTKLSTVGEYGNIYEILCLVLENNEILFRRVEKLSGVVSLKLLCWFSETSRCVQDVSFQPAPGPNVLILCYDNTLHTISLERLFDERLEPHAEIICSYIIPFIGPHECPNAKTCPNNFENDSNRSSISYRSGSDGNYDTFSSKKIDEFMKKNSIISTISTDVENLGKENENLEKDGSDVEVLSDQTGDNESIQTQQQGAEQMPKFSKESTIEENKTFSTSLESSSYPCPFPCCCLWWQTHTKEKRAIIGYSDGTICFVGLSPNCPFISNTSVEKGMVENLVICKDSSLEIISLMITTSLNEQWKLLLEQKSIGYIFPGDLMTMAAVSIDASNTRKIGDGPTKPDSDDDWQFVIPLNEENQPIESTSSTAVSEMKEDATSGIIPSMARLATLGAKKIGALKMKLTESRLKSLEKATKVAFETKTALAVMDAPGQYPEILTTPTGPFFSVQTINERTALGAMHSYSNTLLIHSMDITLLPLFLYKLHKNCKKILLTKNLMYTIQTLDQEEIVNPSNPSTQCQSHDPSTSANAINIEVPPSTTPTPTTQSSSTVSDINDLSVVNVISSSLASMKMEEECEFNKKALLAQFSFPSNERIISIHRRTVPMNLEIENELKNGNQELPQEIPPHHPEKDDFYYIRDYTNIQSRLEELENFDVSDVCVMSNKFPDLSFESCYIVTNKNVYAVNFSDYPHIIFLNLAHAALWPLCEDFCNTFGISLPQCIEYAGDVFLKKRKVPQAITAFNVARIPPLNTARKFALFCECNVLLHICAIALKVTYMIKSKFPVNYHIEDLLKSANDRIELYSKNSIEIPPKSTKCILTGECCSDFNYETDDTGTDLKISNTSLFHLSNYLLLTLCERSIRDRQFMPLWNFISTNSRYHSYLASVVLCESGLYSAAVLLAKVRGIALTVFYCLVKVTLLEPEEFFDIGVLMYNLSEDIFMEAIVYLYSVSHDYFDSVKKYIDVLDVKVVERLERQLNPFDPVYRPLIIKTRDLHAHGDDGDIYRQEFIDWYRNLIETYIIVTVRLKKLKGYSSNFLSALTNFQIKHEEEWTGSNYDYSERFSAGFSYGIAIVNRCSYMWGYNGIHPVFDVKALDLDKSEPAHVPRELTFFAAVLNLSVLAVKCGKFHFLLHTTSGLYSVGQNTLGQLGIGKQLSQSPHPVLIRELDGKKITQFNAGQYHNGVVADGNLYTWGWNVFGQLGHGNIESAYKPKLVKFFKGKKIVQISFGYSHSLVLCENSELYVFGSNHFGQLGIGQYMPSYMLENSSYLRCPLKRLTLPARLEFDDDRIRLIHTRYFTNLLVTENNKLYTWGVSPQSLRLATQAKKRAKQNLAERQKMDKEAAVAAAAVEVISETETTNGDQTEKSDDDKCEEGTAKDKKDNREDDSNVKVEMEIEPEETSQQPKETTVTEEPALTAESFEESTDHFFLTEVDLSELVGDIIEISTGLYHCALITSKYELYTWGKNLERQLGFEGTREDVLLPTRVDCIENPLHVQCGGDFTLVMTSDYKIKAFGNNNSAQCGKEISLKDYSGRLVRLRTSKRVIRIPDGSQYIQHPVEIQLPPAQQNDQMPIVYLKSIPSFRNEYIHLSNLKETLLNVEELNATIDSNLNELCNEETILINSMENSLKIEKIDNNLVTSECHDVTDPVSSHTFQALNHLKSSECDTLNDTIHYCLYIFNGLYDYNNILNKMPPNELEYKIRIHMLHFQFVEAFKLCLVACPDLTPTKAIKIFEYFTKDTNIFPMHTEDLKYFIYEIFQHFIAQKYSIDILEKFFLADLDHYLAQLAYVLFFNNNNSDLERSVLQKYKNLFTDNRQIIMNDCDLILKSVSIKFSVLVCQKIMETGSNDND